MKKIFITGGHVTPALAVIDELQKHDDIEIIFVGRKHAIEGSDEISAEYTLVTERRIKFLSIDAGRVQRSFTLHTIPALLKIPVGFIQAIAYCVSERPALIVSFGGYIALPVAVAGFLFGIPVITHEQTISPGLTNRLIAGISKRVCVTFAETTKQFAKDKVSVTGLPIRHSVFTPQNKSPYRLTKNHPLIYITGGSLGAQSVNEIIFPVVSDLVRKYSIIHQVGQRSLLRAQEIHDHFPESERERYIIEPYIGVDKLSWILANADVVIGRSGANTVIELGAAGKVALLIPLPWASGNEQFLNARWLAENGGAVVREQRDLTPERFKSEVEKLFADRANLQKRASAFSRKVPRDGALRVVNEILRLL